MSTLLLADHDNASLNPATLNAVTAAQKIGGELTLLVAGHNAGPAAEAAAQIPGVTKVLHADAPYFASPTAENVAATVVAVVKAGGFSHVLAAATGYGKNVTPRVAALDRKSTRLNSSHLGISYAVFCLKKKRNTHA